MENNNNYQNNDDSKIIKKNKKLNNKNKNKGNPPLNANLKRGKSLEDLNIQNAKKEFNNKIGEINNPQNTKKSLNKYNHYKLENVFDNSEFNIKKNKFYHYFGIEENFKTDLIHKTNEKSKIYSIVNKFFFKNYKKKIVRLEYIKEEEKFELDTEFIKESQKGQHILKDYCKTYIETTVLPLFKRKDLGYEEKLIIKHNLEEFLKCCEEDKNTYSEYYLEELQIQKEMENKKLFKALRNFRQEFGISENDYADEGIIMRLKKNDYDIYETFQDMFG